MPLLANLSRDEALHEVEVAHLLGYRTMNAFKRALGRNAIPPPDRYLGSRNRDPVWSRRKLEAWLRGELAAANEVSETDRALERLRYGSR